ncbi:MAG: nucleotidyltransferase domain-containing protein [Candidatus Omnitrophica bacterium]|nr:nucleotidyltransferase domain-containing protein [Candidatus Omnitrophota bacterium]
MNELILFSKTIRKLLLIFFTNPNKQFYLRQLCTLINSAPRPLQLALQKLEKAGILNSQKQANLKLYFLNKKNPIYFELKNIILKTEAIGDILAKNLKSLKNIKCAFIYGSVAKNKERANSDIDICIIGEVDQTALDKIIVKLEEKLKREISVVTFSPQEWKTAIKEKKAFVINILQNKKIILIGKLNEF